jgi:outer membrane lipoprotein-sorting protein
VNILRRLPLSRLLLLCGLVVAIGIGATALATALGAGPTPPPKPLPEAIHDALAAPAPAGVSARIQFSNHLIEGANLAGGGSGAAGGLAASPLLTGASGRLWIAADGRTRLELQSEKGDSQILYDGHTVSLYDASTNTLYRYTPQQEAGAGGATDGSSGTATGSSGAAAGSAGTDATHHHAIPTAQEVQEAIAKAAPDATFSAATPTDVAGQPAYTVRISPSRNGGLVGGAELSWDAGNGVPLRAAIYSSTSSAPAIELAATEISYGPVDSATVDFTPPANAKVEEVTLPGKHESQPSGQPAPGGTSGGSGSDANAPTVSTHGEGLAAIRVIEGQAKAGAKSSSSLPEGLPQVKINGATATELATPLGTLLSFERNSVRYLLVGSVTPAAIEAFARGM